MKSRKGTCTDRCREAGGCNSYPCEDSDRGARKVSAGLRSDYCQKATEVKAELRDTQLLLIKMISEGLLFDDDIVEAYRELVKEREKYWLKALKEMKS